ncbi:GNAT family N-acetyltransferase [Lentzea sp. NPDC051208]|uniref:GNAT family N-acetyltransferase n=1 Tax=Lentzea sp. NPDC051208 TaxID=3154642 RepID=UPI003437F683
MTWEDAQPSADLLNAVEAVDKIGENYTAEDTLTELIDPYADLERGSLAAIVTLPGYRNRGVASALLGRALRAASEQGYDRALLSVDSENSTGAFGIFERAGFTSTMRFVRWELEG